MIILRPEDYPLDFYYHRTSSPTYRRYLEGCWPETFDIDPPKYAWKKSLFWGAFHVARYERSDEEPDIEWLKASGVKHAMVAWIPYSLQEKPIGWRRLYLTDHFQCTGFTRIDDVEDYTKKWNDRAKRARKKFNNSWAEVRLVDRDTFITAFRNTKVKHWFKSDYISYYKKITAVDPSAIRQWIVYLNDEPVAGLAVLDYLDNHSVHLVAFTDKKAYDIQWGTGLIDEWFRDSKAKDMKYLTFDQLRNPHGPGDQQGYTEFKENFLECKLSFPKAYFKIF